MGVVPREIVNEQSLTRQFNGFSFCLKEPEARNGRNSTIIQQLNQNTKSAKIPSTLTEQKNDLNLWRST